MADEELRRLARTVFGRAADAALRLPQGDGGYEVRRDLAATMPDGVVLLGDLYVPAGRSGPQPVVVVRLPYGRAAANGFILAATFARHGLTTFIQSTRGTFGSGGDLRPFSTEHEDGLATLAWVREQPWCDGTVATSGGSYFGHTQWAVAPYADPPLAAMGAHVTASRVTMPFYEGGVPGILNALSWSATISRQEEGVRARLKMPVVKAKVGRALNRLPIGDADVEANGAPEAFWRDFTQHAEPDDPFWDQTDHSRAPLDRVPPTNMVTGWWDLFLPGQFEDFARLRAEGHDVRLLVGPWIHGEPGEFQAMLKTDIAWLTHHLHGGPAPTGPRVRVALQNTDTWLGYDAWPPPAAVEQTLRLRAGGRLADEGDPAGGAGSTTFTYDPADPTPSTGGPLLQAPGKQADNRVLEARDDVLVFTGPELTADLDVVGPVRARIHLRMSAPHADLFVRLCDVDAKGRSLNVVDGIRRIEPDGAGVTAADDGSIAVDVELFPTAYRVAAGHRLRVQVSGGAFPRFARNLGRGDPLPSAADVVRNRVEVLHDAQHPSALTLSRLPD